MQRTAFPHRVSDRVRRAARAGDAAPARICAAVFPRARGGARRALGRPDARFLKMGKKKRRSVVQLNVRLTAREADVLRLLARGRTYSQAADELGMSAHTVASHVKNAYRKLDVHSAAAAVLQAVRLGLIL